MFNPMYFLLPTKWFAITWAVYHSYCSDWWVFVPYRLLNFNVTPLLYSIIERNVIWSLFQTEAIPLCLRWFKWIHPGPHQLCSCHWPLIPLTILDSMTNSFSMYFKTTQFLICLFYLKHISLPRKTQATTLEKLPCMWKKESYFQAGVSFIHFANDFRGHHLPFFPCFYPITVFYPQQDTLPIIYFIPSWLGTFGLKATFR